jgi:dihydroorotate dehydrogenase (fumarate)
VGLPSLFEEELAEPGRERPPAGADALELNVYYVSSRPGLSGSDVEWHYLDVVRAVRQATSLPLAVKLSPYLSSLVNLAGQLVEAGANGLVLFNRFYQPDLDIEAMEVLPALELSSSVELRLPLRWIAMMTSALLRNGADHLRLLEVQGREWMDRHGYETLDQLRGRLSQRSVPDPAAFERANYIRTLASEGSSRLHIGP